MHFATPPVADPGERPGGRAPSPLFLDQTEARKAEKKIWGNRLPFSSNLSKGLDDRPQPSPPLPFLISRSGSGTVHH